MLVKTTGKILFEPENITKKHIAQDWKKNALIITNDDLNEYYAWFLKKRFDLKFNKLLRGSHITFISDKITDENSLELFEKAKLLYDYKDITFYYDLEPRTNVKHWWLRVYSDEAENIREIAGLNRIPYFNFHLTLGYINDLNLNHSQYILDTIKLFNIIQNEPRKDLSEHEIIEIKTHD